MSNFLPHLQRTIQALLSLNDFIRGLLFYLKKLTIIKTQVRKNIINNQYIILGVFIINQNKFYLLFFLAFIWKYKNTPIPVRIPAISHPMFVLSLSQGDITALAAIIAQM
jgi:hypothetical protein